MSWKTLLGGAAGFFLGGPAGAAAGASIGGSFDQSDAANEAASTSAAANDRAAQLQQSQFDRNMAMQQKQYEESVQRQQPFLTAGTNALARMQAGEFAQPGAFNANDPRYAQPGAFSFGANDFQADPGYAFRLSEGQRALERTAAARGGLISGTALKAASRYSGDLASQEYQNAYQRALTGYGTQVDRSNTAFSRGLTGYNADVARSDTGYNRLAGMAGVGQTTTQQLNTAGQTMANNLGTAGGNMATSMGKLYSDTGINQGNALMAGAGARASAYGAAARLLPQMNFTNPFASSSTPSYPYIYGQSATT